MTTQFTAMQVMLTLAFIAEAGALIDKSECESERELSGTIAKHLNTMAPVKGNWQLVWGPCIYKIPLIAKYSDNTVYVVQNTSDRSQYVLALSGTNPYEITDWVFEDLLVGTTASWAYGNHPPGARISTSAALSLSILQNMKPCQGIAGADTRLIDFLNNTAGISKLMITGHSLGGEMSTTAALWLADTQGLLWDMQKRVQVSSYGYAGPTAGNKIWADYFHQRLGDNAHRIWNNLDVVPHAWQLSDLKLIPNLYRPQIRAPFWVKLALDAGELAVRDIDYTQIAAVAADQQPLKGKVNTAAPWDSFTGQMTYQHVNAYAEILNIPDVKVITDMLAAFAKPRKLA
ncbi:MAG: hypothetical protein JWM21_4371 [Acidobacteria bacterium]|nr:hypothetical protein [Acidobacteriota bacterium]